MTVGETPIPNWPRNDSEQTLSAGQDIAKEVRECKDCDEEILCAYHNGKTEGYDRGLTEGHSQAQRS